ncbi:bifunctional hydroxymethylpyrimidine kinase/phosphomethylpyrimidine kinase [Mesorhizobium sp.]|uniref:bifunctional hydroxymethylpyrimidine kinase/phosphomethylpyrimidine kinase n=1 Tax=Mesorhizobium sp. TaxID=1871066 RepID=UPI002580ED66|nr:bifunctional hydroxymethylpyrimidine kinase/phosphomethylpyrimidine kinase [Mesorhizobium sp.]
MTAQTHSSVGRIEPMPPGLVAEQMRTALAANNVKAVKIGSTLLSHKAVTASRRDLMPLCRLVTPNLIELAVLTGSTPARR